MKKISWKMILVVIIALFIGAFLGRLVPRDKSSHADHSEEGKTPEEATVWTCSMHPQVKQPKPGKCPICFMDLIPLKKGDDSGKTGLTELHLTPAAEKLAEIETQPVERKFIYSSIRMPGKITMNEQLMAYITARMPGRIDRLFINYTGIPVKKGDHMAEYYSPDLLVAQRELLLAVRDLKKQGKDEYIGYGMSPKKMLKTVKKKLELWGLTEQNVKKIIETGEISQHVVLYAPVGGIVTEKHALEGKYFKTGDRLFTIADLTSVWIMMEAYESDIPDLRYGQEVEFITEAYPGEKFSGRISFIDPVLDKKTRIVNVRVDAHNPDGRLKPGMFIRATVKSMISADGKILMDPSLAGKWICPMHPEIIKDGFGKCDICEMDLVKSETLGYSSIDSDPSQAPLVIPVTAPLKTGKRAIVYVKTGPGDFEGRNVVLGARGDGYYIVKEGLKEGETVVVNGNFKIDSALQILAKPSMMSEDQAQPKTQDPKKLSRLTVPSSFIKGLDMIYSSYFKIQSALSKDDFKDAIAQVKNLKMMIGHISGKDLSKEASADWQKTNQEISNISKKALQAKDINQLRVDFANLTASVYFLAKRFGVSEEIKIKKFNCSMAFDNKGADWLQNTDEIANPYFGEAMLRCGEKIEDIKN